MKCLGIYLGELYSLNCEIEVQKNESKFAVRSNRKCDTLLITYAVRIYFDFIRDIKIQAFGSELLSLNEKGYKFSIKVHIF